jgi:sporulation protein YunB
LPKFRHCRRRKGPLPFRYVLLLTFVIFIFLTATSFWIVNVQIKSALMNIAEFEASKVATTIIHTAVEEEILTKSEQDNLVVVDKNNDGNITSVQFNQRAVHAAKKRVTDNITAKLGEIERNNFHDITTPTKRDSGIVYEIPLGVVTGNAILSTLGPNIPVQYFLLGDVFTDVKSTSKEIGINGAVHEIEIYVEVSVQVVIPFATDIAIAKNTIPIMSISERGDVPQYYNGNGKSNPAIELPK